MISRSVGFLAMLAVLLVGCAQVPQESVELSTTVGRDLAVVHQAHRELAQILFARMRQDVNRFVDEVYAPHQIAFAMARQGELARSTDPSDQRKSLLAAMKVALDPNATDAERTPAMRGMEIFMKKIHDDVEGMRRELLTPLEAQEAEVIGSIDRAHQQIQYANSVVTAHLASIAKVHDAQAELLKTVGVDQDLRKEVGQGLATASDRIGALVDTASQAEMDLDGLEQTAGKIKDAVGDLGKVLSAKPEG